jgi:hypothetical protein
LSPTTRWVPVPPTSSRWLLPTNPRQAASRALYIYHPVTIKGLLGWEVARAVAILGGFRFVPGDAVPPEEVTAILSDNGVTYKSLAVAKANHPSRFVALLLNGSYRCIGVAKMAFNDEGRSALRKEEKAIELAATVLRPPVRAPQVQRAVEGLLILEPVDWLPRATSWRLPGEVAYELGAYSRMNNDGRDRETSAAHGDFAPWNLLRTRDGWVLLDWEHASESRPPFFDVWHYLMQAHSLLGRPSVAALMDGMTKGGGWVGTAFSEYARGCGRAMTEAPAFFDDYISTSAHQLAGRSQKEQQGLSARTKLRQRIKELQA